MPITIDGVNFEVAKKFFTDITWGGKFSICVHTEHSAGIENSAGKTAMSWGAWQSSTPAELKSLLDQSKLTKRLAKEFKTSEDNLAPFIIKVMKTIFKY